MSDLVLKGGVVLDATGERPADVVVGADGTILAIGSALTADRVLDATGCVVAPGFVDLFCAVGEPGRCEAETVESASRAAVLGGYTALVVRPDDDHPLDSAAAVRELRDVASV
ncbi:MAG: dihydroorotase, partial [Acidimicrobiia bacterium]|nr:dihydroorotase [Acidimicrobiia bacterium]